MAQVDTEKIGGLPIRKVGERSSKIKLLVYGDPGVGKTRLAATAWDVPIMRPVLFVDMEAGTDSFKDLYSEIETVEVKDTLNSTGRMVKTAWENFSNVYEELRKGKYDYNTIVIDSLTEAYDLAKRHWLHNVVQTNPDRDPDMPAMRDWVKQGALMRRLFRLFRDLDKHVIYTALKSENTTDEGKIINYTPDLPGKLAYQIVGFVNTCVYMDAMPPSKKDGTEKGTRRLLTQPVNKYLAKDRDDALPLTIENPTMALIAEAILGKGGA